MEKLESLPPIPTPASQRWKEIRIQFLPLVVFVLAIIAVILLWNSTIKPASVVGEVEVNTADVLSHQEGQVVELTVDRFTEVKAGQVIGYVQRGDAEMAQAQAAIINADQDIMAMRIRVTEERRRFDLQQLRVDLDNQLTLQAENAPLLIEASNSFVRAQALIQDDSGPISIEEFDVRKARFESLKTSLANRANLITKLTGFIAETERQPPIDIDQAINAAKAAQIAELEKTRRTPLRAPISGMVSELYKAGGESVLQGEAVLRISSTGTERIVAYIYQPIVKRPRVGDPVSVRTRTQPPLEGTAQILKVGGQIEEVKRTLIHGDQTTTVPTGLPLLVSLPKDFRVYPGELLDLSIQYSE